MLGDGLSFAVNPAAGGESAGVEWAGIVAPRDSGGGSRPLPLSELPVRSGGEGSGAQTHPSLAEDSLRAIRSRERREGEMV